MLPADVPDQGARRKRGYHMRPSRRDWFRKFRAVPGSAVIIVLILFGFIRLQEIRAAEGTPAPARQSVGGQPAPRPKASANLYAAEPAPLSTAQCGQCHPAVFGELKTSGGRHRFSCQDCHRKFHAYNPVKGNWQELMPKCGDCHAAPHGEKLTNCSHCHGNPHAITQISQSKALLDSCTLCHSTVGEQLRKSPSAHGKLSCGACHTSHGYKPDCSTCHAKPHNAQLLQKYPKCLTCHLDAHNPPVK
jgi:hypothetical protein